MPVKKKRQAASLFSTLASIDETDKSATKRRKANQLHSLQQSRAAADQTKLNGILLELRILTQRCLTEGEGIDTGDADVDVDVAGDDEGSSNNSRVKEEVDTLLENLLVARRELMGHQLDKSDDNDDTPKSSDVDYASLITKKSGNDETSSDEESSTNSSSDKNNLTKQLNNEYTSLQNHWKSTLNKHHSNLALHSGMSVNSSKFQSKAVDVSFWEQVQGGMEHDRFKQRKVEHEDDSDSNNMENLQFDDSKLYQQMLKDFISSSQGAAKTNKRGIMMDPAQEAATRLKRAMRKKSGGGADIDLTSLLTEGNTAANSNSVVPSAQNLAMLKKKASVDRRASKGRKIRYAVLPKLVNFTFPVSRPEPMIKEDVWFKSLFGGVGRI